MQPPLPPPPDQLGALTGAMPSWRPEDQAPSLNYAGFWARFAATLLDGLLLAPFAIALLWPVFSTMMDEINRAIQENGTFDSTAWATRYAGRFTGTALLLGALTYLYQAVMIGQWNATVGKFALRLRVRKPDGTPAGWREALLRPLLQVGASVVGVLVPIGPLSLIDYLWMLWDKQKQTLHDKVASTVVVQQ
jgi:uncharacterized RDD family membrane protein YckC